MKAWMHNRLLPRLTLILGLVTTGAAVLHMVAVIGVAYRERGGYDARLADLLWIGWTSLICGGLMIASSRGLGRGSRTAFRTATGAAAVFLVGGMTIAPIDPSFWTAAPLYGGYLVLAFWLRRGCGSRHRVAHPTGGSGSEERDGQRAR